MNAIVCDYIDLTRHLKSPATQLFVQWTTTKTSKVGVTGPWWGQSTTDQYSPYTCWRHQMETFSTLLALCVTGGFPSQRPVTRSFGIFFDLFFKQTVEQTIETPVIWDTIASRSLWCDSNERASDSESVSIWWHQQDEFNLIDYMEYWHTTGRQHYI